MSFKLKISVPSKLPKTSEGNTPVQFKTWRDRLIIYLKQSKECRLFLEGGIYQTWTAAVVNPNRVPRLDQTDQPGRDDGTAADHLIERQTQLATMLSLIAGVVDDSQYEDVMKRSTSVAWIWSLVEVDFNIQKKGKHFLKVDAITYNRAGAEAPLAFYKRLRSFFSDNLRKTGELEASNNNVALAQDEVLSPTLENTIVYMALKSIDPRLPTQIGEVHGHLMNSNTTLYDLHSDIFNSVPDMITKLDKEANLGSISQQEYVPDAYASYEEPYEEAPEQIPTFAAMNTGFGRGQFRPRGAFNFRPRFQARQRATFRRFPSVQNPRYETPSGKFCTLCRDAGLPSHVVRTHNMNQCSRLSKSTVSQMRSMVLEEDVDPSNYPDPDGSSSENYEYFESS